MFDENEPVTRLQLAVRDLERQGFDGLSPDEMMRQLADMETCIRQLSAVGSELVGLLQKCGAGRPRLRDLLANTLNISATDAAMRSV